MFRNVKEDKIDIKKINETVSLLDRILKICYVVIIMFILYLVVRLISELKIVSIVLSILKILLPLFIGIFIAWLFAPGVKKLQQKGIKRGIGAAIIYVIFLGVIVIVVSSIIPILRDQINELIKSLPSILDSLITWISNLLNKFNNVEGLDINSIKQNIFNYLQDLSNSITTSLPELAVNTIRTIISGLGYFVVGLIIGFYLLVGFDNASELIITLLPKKFQKDTRNLSSEVNESFRRFINGAIIDAFFVFIITSLAFALVNLRAPLLFGFFCGITNIIPYAGPYIGGVPAVIVGFSQGPITGVLTLISIVVIQFLEGNFLQPVIMSKTTKLHPVTIIIGLLLFGHFFGIVGMVISTPLIAASKSIVMFFMKKYDIDLFENL